jgi:hypothetical protein
MESEYIYEADLNSFGEGGGVEHQEGQVSEEVIQHDGTGTNSYCCLCRCRHVEFRLLNVWWNCFYVVEEATAAAVAGIPDDNHNEHMVEESIVEGGEMQMMDHTGIVDGGQIISGDQIPIIAAPPHIPNTDVEISQEDELKSMERLDRSSPDLWPQNCTGWWWFR